MNRWKDLLPWKRRGVKRPEDVENQPRPWTGMQRDLNRVFDDFHESLSRSLPFGDARNDWRMELPTVDVTERKARVDVTADVPGLSEEDIELTLSPAGDVLHLKGQRQHETPSSEEQGWKRQERYFGVVHRSIQLPCPVLLEGAKATLKKGVLRVEFEKRQPASESNRIRISRG